MPKKTEIRELGASLTVVIPMVATDAPLLCKAIQTVENQNWAPTKIIVLIDNCSKLDFDSASAIRSLKIPTQLIPVLSRGGPGFGRQIGFLASDSNYVAFLDVDDAWRRDKLKIQMSNLEGISGIASGYLNLNTQGESRAILFEGTRVTRTDLERDNFIPTSSVVLNRSTTFAQDFSLWKYRQDWITWLSILKRTDFKYIPEPLVIRNVRRGHSRNKLRMAIINYQVNRKIIQLGVIESAFRTIKKLNRFQHYFSIRGLLKK